MAESVSQKWNEGLCESTERGVRHFQQSQFIYMQNKRNSQQLVFVQPHKR